MIGLALLAIVVLAPFSLALFLLVAGLVARVHVAIASRRAFAQAFPFARVHRDRLRRRAELDITPALARSCCADPSAAEHGHDPAVVPARPFLWRSR